MTKGLRTNLRYTDSLSSWMGLGGGGARYLEPEVVGTVVVPDLVSKGKDTL